jgi:hypothetical protein
MEVRIHEDWKFNHAKFDADIAVVTLFNPVDLQQAQPICLPSPNSGEIIRNGGIIVRTFNSFEASLVMKLKF